MNKIIIAIVAVAVVLVGGYFLFQGTRQPAPSVPQASNSQSVPQASNPQSVPQASNPQTAPRPATEQPVSQPPAPEPPAQQPPQSPPQQVPKIDSFTVTGNDSAGSPTSINVKSGDTVQITFRVQADGTYHGGLDFRSPVVNTGTIAPGGSKTITFIASNSFAFTPYWPATNIKKPYTINVAVE